MKFMNTIVNTLIAVALITLACAVANVFGFIPESFISQDRLSSLPAIAISSGLLIASITYLHNRATQLSESKRKSDEINLLLAKDGLDETYTLLKDLNNDRVTWLRAARILCNSIALKEEINHPEYIKSFQVAEERLRNQLYRLLQTDPQDPSVSGRVSLPPQFFYGIDNWRDSSISLDEAAISSKSPIEAYKVEMDKVTPTPKLGGLAESSIIAIYNFMKYPENYYDPLSKIELWSGHYHDTLEQIEQGPRRYIAHKQKYFVADGKIHERNETKPTN